MTDRELQIQETIDRYLANRLSDSERALVETKIVGDPAFRQEVELSEALRDGLRELQKQGGVAPLLKTRAWIWRRSASAIAASFIGLALGVAAVLLYQRLGSVQHELAPAPGNLVVAALRFERTRGDGATDVTWRRSRAPALLEMQFDVGLDAASGYSVFIERIGAGADTPVLKANAASSSADGIVAISIHSTLLAPADYRIRLESQPASQLHPDPTLYVLRIAD
jgi:hypothetical protein